MTDATCRPLRTVTPIAQREQRADQFGELLECMADLLVETHGQRLELEQHVDEDPRVPEAIARLTELERSFGKVGVEAASVHQLLQHIHLI